MTGTYEVSIWELQKASLGFVDFNTENYEGTPNKIMFYR